MGKRFLVLLISLCFLVGTCFGATVTIIERDMRYSFTKTPGNRVYLEAKNEDITGWRVNSGGVALDGYNSFVMPDNDVEVEALYPAAQEYLLTVENFGSRTEGLKIAGTEVEVIATEDENYRFTEWVAIGLNLSEVERTSLNISFIMPNNEVTLIANYETPIPTYTISYDANGGIGAPNSQTKVYSVELIIDSTIPTRSGYDFLGWSTNRNATTPEYLPGGIYEEDGNKTLYAVWEAQEVETYTITYNLNGGTVAGTNPTSYTVESGNITLINPTKPGYTFTGWTGTEIDSASTNVVIRGGSVGNRIYTATWSEAIEYTITYNLGGGTVSGTNPTSYTVESGNITLINPTRIGYVFTGWTGTELGSASINVVIPRGSTGNRSYTATWQEEQTEAETYAIIYNLDGGTVSGTNPTSYTVESEDITLINPSKEGYTFTGWTGTGITGTSTNVVIPRGSTGDRTYTATWSVVDYTITYNLDGGTVAGTNPTNYTVESGNITLINPTQEGKIFAGWEGTGITGTSTNVVILRGSTGNRTYTATWIDEVEAEIYTITYILDGGIVEGTNPTAYTVESEDITLINPSKEGYTFTGWTGTELENPSTNVVIPTGSTGNRTYTATWSVIEYTITYELNGGTVAGTNPTSYTVESEDITLINPSKEGYTFTGWTGTGITGTSTNVVIPRGSIGNRTYTATWSEDVVTYIVTYVVTEGTGAPSSQEKLQGIDLILTNEIPTSGIEGIIFSHWIDNDTGIIYEAGATFIEDKDTVLEACWTDSVAPTGTAEISKIATNQESVAFTATVSDIGYGIDRVEVRGWFGEYNDYSKTFELTDENSDGVYEGSTIFAECPNSGNNVSNGEGLYNFEAWAIDRAGNTTNLGEFSCYYDITMPEGDITISTTQTNEESVSFIATATDNLSGVKRVYVNAYTGGAEWVSGNYAKTFEFEYDYATGQWVGNIPFAEVPDKTTNETNQGAGNYYYVYWVEDNAGNRESKTSRRCEYDATVPRINNLVNSSNGEWCRGLTISFEVEEVGSGLDRVEWSKNDSEFINPIIVTPTTGSTYEITIQNETIEGTAYIRAIDKVGNISIVSTTPLKLDNIRPTGTFEVVEITDTSITFRASAYDEHSGLSQLRAGGWSGNSSWIEYHANSERHYNPVNHQEYEMTINFADIVDTTTGNPAPENGPFYFCIMAYDNVTNNHQALGYYTYAKEAETYTVNYVTPDGITAPETQTKTEGADLILPSNVPASPNEEYEFFAWSSSEEASTAYESNGFATTETVADVGYQPEGIFSIDADTTLYAVYNDITAPTGTAEISATATNQESVSFTADVTDNGSGIGRVEVKRFVGDLSDQNPVSFELVLNDTTGKYEGVVPFENEGIYLFEVRAYDNAGNETLIGSYSCSYDITMPQGSVTISKTVTNETSVSFTATVSDNLTGLKKVYVNGWTGDIDWDTKSKTFYLTDEDGDGIYEGSANFAEVPHTTTNEINQGDGTYSFLFWVEDNAGNKEAKHTVRCVYDATAPSISNLVNTSNGDWCKELTLTWDIEEEGSGIDAVQWSIGNTNFDFTTTHAGSWPEREWYGITRSNSRNDIVYFRAVDKAGNISPLESVIMKIDNNPPTGTFEVVEITDTAITFKATAKDTGSGLKLLRTGAWWGQSSWDKYHINSEIYEYPENEQEYLMTVNFADIVNTVDGSLPEDPENCTYYFNIMAYDNVEQELVNCNSKMIGLYTHEIETIKYQIEYNTNGGTGGPEPQSKTQGIPLTIAAKEPERDGHIFLGWSESSTATSATYQPAGKFTKDANTILYAVWKVGAYTVQFDANGGTGAPDPITKNHGQDLQIPGVVPTSPTSEHDFLGWSEDSTATTGTYQPGGIFNQDKNTVLYAIYRDTVSPTGTATIAKTATNEASVLFTATAQDLGEGIDRVVVMGYTGAWKTYSKTFDMPYNSETGKYEGYAVFEECPNSTSNIKNNGDARYDFGIWAYDKAGNRTKLAHLYCYYDTAVPTGTAAISSTLTNAESVTITATAEDSLSGVDYVQVRAWYGSEEWASTHTPYNITSVDSNGKYKVTINFADIKDTVSGETNNGDGTYWFSTFAYDKAGNSRNIGKPSCVYDGTVPTGSNTISKTATNATSVSFTATASDNLSGVKRVYVNGYTGGNKWVKYSKTFELAYNSSTGKYQGSAAFAEVPHTETNATNQGEGKYNFVIWVEDNAGNKAAYGTTSCIYDTTAPVISNLTNSSGGNWCKTLTLDWDITESGSGIDKVQWSLNNNDFSTSTGKFSSSEWEGITRNNTRNDHIYIRAVDKAGNISNVIETDMKIDNAVPTGTSEIASITDTTITFKATVDDGPISSGLKSLRVGAWWGQSTYKSKHTNSEVITEPVSGTEYAMSIDFADIVNTIDGTTTSDACTYYFDIVVYDKVNNYTNAVGFYSYNKAANTYTVKYNGNGATGGSTASSSHTYGEEKNLTANGYTKTGHSFAGWATSANGSVVYSNNQSVVNLTATNSGIVTLYANWNANQYTATLDQQGATKASTPSSVKPTYGSAMPSITLPERKYIVTYNYNGGSGTPANKEVAYTFNGFWTGVESGEKYYNANGTSAKNWDKTSNTTLYARWTSASTTLPTPSSRTGYTFTGWYKEAGCVTKVGNAGASYTPTANITLYAGWKDSTAPTGSATIAKTATNATSVLFTATATDGETGIDKVVVKGYTGAWKTYSETFDMPYNSSTGKYEGSAVFAECPNSTTSAKNQGEAQYNFVVWAYDKEGNATRLGNFNCKYDTTVPTGSNTISKTATNATSVSFTATASDNLAGVKRVYVNGYTGGNKWIKYSKTFELAYNSSTGKYQGSVAFAEVPHTETNATNQGQGKYNFVIWVEDNAGNKAAYGTTSCIYDTTAPVISNLTNSSGGSWCTELTIAWDIKEEGSGIDKVQWSLNNNNFSTSTGNFSTSEWYKITRNTTRNDNLYIRVIDKAGNVSNIVGPTPMKIDRTAPTGTSSIVSKNDTTITFKASATDEYSGIKLLRVGAWWGQSAWKTYHTNSNIINNPTNGTEYTMTINFADIVNTINNTKTAESCTYYFSVMVYDNMDNARNIGTYSYNKAANTYTVKYDGNGATGGSMDNTGHTVGVDDNLPDNKYTKTGHSFAGWATSANGSVVYSNKQSVKNLTTTNGATVTLYAKWTANKYGVTLNNQGATSAGSTSVSPTYGKAMPSIVKPTKEYTVTYNYNGGTGTVPSAKATSTFGGYYTETGGKGTQYYTAAGASARNWDIASDKTLYAKWTDASITIPGNKVATRTGYIFEGWATSANGAKAYNAGETYKPTNSVTLYAVWTPKKVVVTFNRNFTDTDTTTKTQEFTYGVSGQAFSAKGWTRDGYTLLGWSFDKTATEKSYNVLAVVTDAWINSNSPNATLYAVWKPNGNTPVLSSGLTPVNWDGSKWVKTTVANWDYNYTTASKWSDSVGSNSYGVGGNGTAKWANAMLDADGDGTLESLFVWIPRFTYKTVTGNLISWNADTSGTARTYIKFSNGTTDNTSDGYVTHGAFNPGGTAITGFWVGKYEATRSDATASWTGNSLTVTSQPGKLPHSNVLPTDAYSRARNLNNDNPTLGINLGSHMMKDSEWGAVAYFTSALGRIPYVNPTKTTGYASSTQNGGDAEVENSYAWNTEYGVRASTTHNIYGIYDMAGGLHEFVAAMVETARASEIANLRSADAKYVDKYASTGKVTSPDSANIGWDSDTVGEIWNDPPAYTRGGFRGDASAGIFDGYKSQNTSVGVKSASYTYRLALFGQAL